MLFASRGLRAAMFGRAHPFAILSTLVTCGVLLLSSPALAQEAAVAEALFKEGKALMNTGDYAKACPKLAESQRIDASPGTLLNLALCYRKAGKTASAWAAYLEALTLARQQKREAIAKEAQQKAEELATDLSYLTIVTTAALRELVVKRDDLRLEASSLGSKLPVDPGQHTVSASAPGYQPVSLKIAIGERGDAQTVMLPELRRLGDSPAPTPGTPPTTKPSSGKTEVAASPEHGPSLPPQHPVDPNIGRKTAAYAIGVGGLVATAAGATFGALALSTYADAEAECKTHSACSDDAMTLRERAGTRATIANIGLGVGIAALATSGFLLLTGRQTSRSATATSRMAGAPVVFESALGKAGGGIALAGAF